MRGYRKGGAVPDSGDVYGFRSARRGADAEIPAIEVPPPFGWNPAGTYTKDPRTARPSRDAWDDRPARSPYPPAMPSLDDTSGGFGDIDVHVRAMRGLDRVVHEGLVLYAAGDRTDLARLRAAIRRRVAIREELGSGVVVISDAERMVLEDDDREVTA